MIITGVITIIPLWVYFMGAPKLIPEQDLTQELILKYVVYLVFVVAVGIGFNVILSHTSLVEQSQNFKQAKETLSDGSFWIKIACSVVVIPILEELLIRGIICGQLAIWYNPALAVIISSIFFGILHNNIVQFIYALIIGLALGFIYIKSKRLILCIVGHSIINLLVILLA